MPNILIASDLCPIGINELPFKRGDASTLLGDFAQEFGQADSVFVNLECPLIEQEAPVTKDGPNLGADVSCVEGLRSIGVAVAGLANNHTMDHGAQGLQSTISALEGAGIAHIGAGNDLAAAQRILVKELDGLRIGFLAMAEHEFGVAQRDRPGVNPLDVKAFVRIVATEQSRYDRLVVILHGGNEYYAYPRPELVDTCRFLVEQGANAVVCQHSHCVGCMETYQGAPIVYGQGNFLFDMPSSQDTWHEGMLIRLDFDGESCPKVSCLPYIQSLDGPGLRRMSSLQEEDFLDAFHHRSAALADPAAIEHEWASFCARVKRGYLHRLHGKPGILRRIAGKLDVLHLLDSPGVQCRRLNMIRCESHREVLVTVLEKETNRV